MPGIIEGNILDRASASYIDPRVADQLREISERSKKAKKKINLVGFTLEIYRCSQDGRRGILAHRGAHFLLAEKTNQLDGDLDMAKVQLLSVYHPDRPGGNLGVAKEISSVYEEITHRDTFQSFNEQSPAA